VCVVQSADNCTSRGNYCRRIELRTRHHELNAASFRQPGTIRPSRRNIFGNRNVTVARRQNHTATLLHNGMVLIAGGNGDAGGLASGGRMSTIQRLENFQSPGACPRQGHGTRQRCCETATYSSPAERLPTTPLSYSTGLSRAWNYANSAETRVPQLRVAPPCRDFVAQMGWSPCEASSLQSGFAANSSGVPLPHRAGGLRAERDHVVSLGRSWLTPAVGTKGLHLYTSRRWPILITRTTSRRSSMVYRMR